MRLRLPPGRIEPVAQHLGRSLRHGGSVRVHLAQTELS